MIKKGIFKIVMIGISLFLIISSSQSQDWKKEYEDICSKTSDAMTLTADELKLLIERCEKLKAVIESLDDESTKRVYLRKLQMCRDLYQFCLEHKTMKR